MWFQNLPDPEEAGWFQEMHSTPDKFGKLWSMTPRHKLQQENGIVLLSTGGYAPIHDGHIAMMEAAKIHMEAKGFRVLGGYVSPGHDDYVVSHKNIPISAPERLAYANRRLKNHPWMMVDPWEAIGCTCSVNFTTVIDHLESLLNRRICYVVGSDNERFSLAFKDRGLLCVVRRTADVLPNPKYRGRTYNHSEHVFTADNEPIPGSSTAIRKELRFGEAKKKKIILRVDVASEPYVDQLIDILVDYYTSVYTVHVSSQRLPEIPNLISLDQMIESPFGNLGLSRNYVEGGYYKLGYTNRPSCPPLEEQVKLFSGKIVSLFDDDVVSGNTLRRAAALLQSVNCKVLSYHALSFSDGGACEIMDSRDFLPVPEGGLVVCGKRVPYIYPYVCPFVRASVLPKLAEEFSNRIRQTFWE